MILKEKSKNEQADREKDYYSSVLLGQIICCIVAVALFFIFRSSGYWEELKTLYSELLEEDFITAKTETVMADLSARLFSKDTAYVVSGSKVESFTDAEESVFKADTAVAESTAELSEISYKPDRVKADSMEFTLSSSDGFAFPVVGGRYTSYFGERTDPISLDDDYHKGIDIGADEGDRIRAFADGKVTSVGEDSRSGKYLFISHANGYVTFYCHCNEVLVKEGTIIRKGETVALVGSTGYSTGPHLHFEIRLNGESIDPLPFLKNAA